jgi:hypothetical protein
MIFLDTMLWRISKKRFYQKPIGKRKISAEKLYVVSLHDVNIFEYLFVQSMKPGGWLRNFIVEVQCCIWMKMEEWKDKIILSQPAVVSINLSK